MSWLVDTNVISELSRKSPHAAVLRWLVEHQDGLFLSVLTHQLTVVTRNVSDLMRAGAAVLNPWD